MTVDLNQRGNGRAAEGVPSLQGLSAGARGIRLAHRGGAVLVALAACFGSLLAGSAARAQERSAVTSQADSPALAERQVTFSGFQALPEGGGRLFIHLTAKPEFRVNQTESQIIVRLLDTDVGVRNNRNPLDLSQFNVLLLRAQLVTRGSDVEWVLTLRKPVKLQPSVVEKPGDGVSLQIDIPAA